MFDRATPGVTPIINQSEGDNYESHDPQVRTCARVVRVPVDDQGRMRVDALPVLSGPAIERIANSQIKEVVATDSVPMSEAAKKMGKIKVLSVADLLARGIRSIHEETSISELFI